VLVCGYVVCVMPLRESEFLTERCLVTQISDLTIKARKKWTIRVGGAGLEA
jgi:hypothetical protein